MSLDLYPDLERARQLYERFIADEASRPELEELRHLVDAALREARARHDRIETWMLQRIRRGLDTAIAG